MDGLSIQIKRGTEKDIPFVMATERGAGYEEFVGRWDERRHRSALKGGGHAYFIGYVQQRAVGFVIFKDWASPEGVTLLKRIAVVNSGHGVGKRLLQAVLAAVYRETDVQRIGLGCFQKIFVLVKLMSQSVLSLKVLRGKALSLAAYIVMKWLCLCFGQNGSTACTHADYLQTAFGWAGAELPRAGVCIAGAELLEPRPART